MGKRLIDYTAEQFIEILLNAYFHEVSNVRPNKKPSINTEFLTRKEAASILKISLPTLDRLTLNGDIKVYRIGNMKRYKKDEILMSTKKVEENKYRRGQF